MVVPEFADDLIEGETAGGVVHVWDEPEFADFGWGPEGAERDGEAFCVEAAEAEFCELADGFAGIDPVAVGLVVIETGAVLIALGGGIGDGHHAGAAEEGVEGGGAFDVGEREDLLIEVDGTLGGEAFADGPWFDDRHPEHVEHEVIFGTAVVGEGEEVGEALRFPRVVVDGADAHLRVVHAWVRAEAERLPWDACVDA